MIKKAAAFLAVSVFFAFFAPSASAADTAYSGNFVIPENQSGFKEAAYEHQVGQKLERGAKNLFLSPLEIPHGIKSEYYYRKQEYLPGNLESFFIGAFKGLINGFGRLGVGFYEIFTSPYPQDPILPEMEEWLY